jgi:ABC-type branched-subunit amino acid transport system ATPase component
MAICQKIQVIDRGHMLTFAPPDEVRRDQRIIEAYLGKSDRAKRHA